MGKVGQETCFSWSVETVWIFHSSLLLWPCKHRVPSNQQSTQWPVAESALEFFPSMNSGRSETFFLQSSQKRWSEVEWLRTLTAWVQTQASYQFCDLIKLLNHPVPQSSHLKNGRGRLIIIPIHQGCLKNKQINLYKVPRITPSIKCELLSAVFKHTSARLSASALLGAFIIHKNEDAQAVQQGRSGARPDQSLWLQLC